MKAKRKASNYPRRLAKRGQSSASVRMPFYDKRQGEHDTIEGAIRANKGRGEGGEE